MKDANHYPFSVSQKKDFKYNQVREHNTFNLSSNLVVNNALMSNLYVKQKGIYYGLYDHNGKEVLNPEYDNYFEVDEEGVLIFRKTDYSKKDGNPEQYSYGFLNVHTRAKTLCIFNKITKLFPGLYDAQSDYVRHYLIKSDCVKEYDYFRSIEVINDKIVFLSGWSHPRVVNNNGVIIFKDMNVSVQDFKYGHVAAAYNSQGSWIVNDDGEKVLQLPYKKILGVRNGYAPVSDGEKWGYVDLRGRIVVPCEYLYAGVMDDNGYVYVQKTDFLNKLWGSTKIKFTDLLSKHLK